MISYFQSNIIERHIMTETISFLVNNYEKKLEYIICLFLSIKKKLPLTFSDQI